MSRCLTDLISVCVLSKHDNVFTMELSLPIDCPGCQYSNVCVVGVTYNKQFSPGGEI